MATPEEIATALFSLGRYQENYTGLRAKVPVTEQLQVPAEWKQADQAQLIDVPVPVRWLVFERASLQAPWVFVDEVIH